VATDQRHLEVFVLSYVPRVVADEKYNVGLVALERSDDRTHYIGSRFIPDTERLLAFDPDADVNMLLSQFREIEQRLRDLEGRDAFLQMMLETFSNTIQISDGKTVIISGDPAGEIDRLVAVYMTHGA
jgi:hypothetical protein